MNQEDGKKILKLTEDFINTELAAGNRITKNNGSFFGQQMTILINNIIKQYEQKEKIKKEIKEKRNQEIKKQKNIVKKVSNDIKKNKMLVMPSEK